MNPELKHMLEEHTDEVVECFGRKIVVVEGQDHLINYGKDLLDEINDTIGMGVTDHIDFNELAEQYIICAAERALHEHDGDFNHEPDEEEGER